MSNHYSLRWTFSVIHLIVATFLVVGVSPYQFKPKAGASIDYVAQHWSPTAGQIAIAINFPAEATTTLLSRISIVGDRPLFRYRLYDVGFWFSDRDFVFLLSVAVLWYFIGQGIDRWQLVEEHGNAIRRSKTFIVGGIVLSIVTIAVALEYLLFATRPYQQIAPAGMIWGAFLIVHFVQQLRPGRVAKPSR